MFQAIYKFFDKIEDYVRAKLSHYPLIYGFLAGVGVVVFWRGVWHTADYLSHLIQVFSVNSENSIDWSGMVWWDGPLSLLIGSLILLTTGTFVTTFIGNELIISGLKGDKKVSEKTEKEVKEESGVVLEIKTDIKKLKAELKRINPLEEQKKEKRAKKPRTV